MLPAKFGILAAALSSCPPCEPPPIQDICGHDLPALPAPTSVEEVAETDATRLMDAFEQGMDLMNSIDCRLPALGTSYTPSRTHEGLWAWIKPRLQTLETERMTVSRVGEHSDSSFGAFFPKVLSPIKPYEVMKMLTPQSDRTTKQSPKVGGRKRALKLQSPEDILSDLSGILTQLAAVCEDSDFTSNEEKFSLLSRFSELFASSFPSLDPQLQTVQELCRSAVSVVSNVLMAGAANKYGSPAPLLVVRLLFLFLSIAAIPRGFFRDDVSDSAVEHFISAADEWADALEKSVRGSEDVKEPRKKKLRVAAKSSLSSAVDIAAIQLLTECIRNSLLVLPFTQASRLVQVCGRFLEVASHGFDVLSSSLSSLLTHVILATRMPELVGQLAARFATWDKPKRRWIASDIMISLADSKITDVLGVLVAPFADRTANLKVLVEDTLDSLENIDMPGAVLLLEGILNVVLPSAKDKADMLGLVVSRLFAIQQDAVSFITSFGVEQAAHEDGRAMVQCGHGCARWFPLPAGTPTTPVDWSCIDCRIKSLLPPLPLAGSDNVATGRLAYLICGLSLITQDRASSFVVRCLDTDFAAIDGIQKDQLLPVLLEKSIPTSVAYHVVLTSSSLSPVQFLEPMLDMLLTLFADANNKCQQRTKAFDTLKSIVQGDRKDRLLDTALGDKHAPIRKAALTIVERDVHVKLIRRVLPLLDDSLKSVRKKTLDTLNKMVRSGSPIAADDAAQIVSRVIYLLSLPIDRKARFFALSAYGADFDHNLIDLLVLLFTVKPELLVGALDLHGELTKQWDSYLEDNWLCRICKTGKLGNDYRNHPILDNYIAHLSKAPVSYALSSIEEAVRCVEASSPSAPADADLHRISFLCRFLENNVLPEPLVLRLTKFGLQRALNPAGNESCHVIMRLLSLLYAYPKVQSVIEKNVIEKPLLELQANSATTASNKVRFMCLLSHALLQFPSRFSVRKLLDVVLNYCHAGSDQPLLSAFALQALIALLCLDPKACMAHQGVLQTILQGATYGDVAQTYLLTSLIRFFKTDTSSLSVALSQTLLQPVCFEVLSSRSPAVRLQAVRWLKTAIDHSLLEPASVAPQILALYADRSDLVTDKASSLVAILPPDAVHTSTLVSASNLAFDRLYASRENHRLFVAGFRQRMSVFHDWLLSPVRKGIISNKAILGWLCDTVRSLCVLDRSVDSAREAELQQAVLKAVNRVLFFAQAFVYLPYQGDEACIVLYQLQTQLDVQLAEYMDESETLSPAVRLLWASSLAVLQQFSLCLRARYCISVADMERVELGSLGGRHAVAKQSVTRERNEVLFHLRGLDSALEAIAAGTYENGQVIAQVDALLDRSSVMLTAGTMDRSFIIGAVKKEDKEDKEDRDDEVDHEDEEEEDDDDA